jgi:NAD(P)H-hydrate epimerase
MQAIEHAADASGHSYAQMMELAGMAVARTILTHYGSLRPTVVVVVGPGHNGGDGLVCARHLQQAGLPVYVYLWKRRAEPNEDEGGHLTRLAELGVPTAHADGDPGFNQLHAWLNQATLLVDALLGTGANRPISGQLAELLTRVTAVRATRPHLDVVAVDCASGLQCDTGRVDPHTLPANITVTFAYAKLGHYQFPGASVSGVVEVVDIGIAPALGDALRSFVLSAEMVRPWLPARPPVSHKGSFGKALAAVGCINYPGAAYLCCAAAARVGAGLVTGAVAQPVWPVVASRLAEATWLPLPTGEGDAAGVIDASAAEAVVAALSGYDALLVGCGLGQRPTTQHFVQQLLAHPALPPTVIDADGLNCLARLDDWSRCLPIQTILTPHLAEMARLCQLTVGEVTSQRWALARQKAAEWNAVVLLKGPYTVIADPQGWLAVLPVATPALATAGTGDVLAGAILGLLAQGVAPFAAACLGAWLHGAAGLHCAVEIGDAGVLASDLLPRLPQALRSLGESG